MASGRRLGTQALWLRNAGERGSYTAACVSHPEWQLEGAAGIGAPDGTLDFFVAEKVAPASGRDVIRHLAVRLEHGRYKQRGAKHVLAI